MSKIKEQIEQSLFLQYQEINVFQIGDKSCLSLLQFVITDQHPLVLVADPRTVVGGAWRLSFVNNSSNCLILEGTNPDIISSESCYLPVIESLERGNLWSRNWWTLLEQVQQHDQVLVLLSRLDVGGLWVVRVPLAMTLTLNLDRVTGEETLEHTGVCSWTCDKLLRNLLLRGLDVQASLALKPSLFSELEEALSRLR